MDRRNYDRPNNSTDTSRTQNAADLRRIVGRRLGRARRRHGWKQAELAEAIGGTVRMVSRYETGRTLPRLGVLLQIAATLGVSLDFLAGRVDDPLHPGEASPRADPPQERR